MWPDCQLRAFNSEVIDSFTIALSPCSHSYPPTLVPSFGNDGEGCYGWCIAFSFHDTSSPRTWRSSVISPNSVGPSLIILLLHLSVIQAYPWVHVPSAILSGVLWAVVAPIALPRGHIHINGVRVLAVCI